MRVDDCRAGEFQCTPEVYESGFSITFVMTDAEVATLLAGYDPLVSASPTSTVSRSIARPIADALKQKIQGVQGG